MANHIIPQPYMFEPEYEEGEEPVTYLSDSDSDGDSRSDCYKQLGNTDWCQCGHCISMATSRECICCREWDILFSKLRVSDGCITRHGDFGTICLTDSVLLMSFVQHMLYKGVGGRAPDTLTNSQSRLAAYRNFISWVYSGEPLGKGVRKVIPSCVVGKIRSQFPSAEYTGFKEAREALTFHE